MGFWKHKHSIKGQLVVGVEITPQYVLLQCALALLACIPLSIISPCNL